MQRLQSVVLGVIWFLSPLGCLFYQSGTLCEVASLSDSNKLSRSSFPVRIRGQKDASWCERSQSQPLPNSPPFRCFGDYFQAQVWLRFWVWIVRLSVFTSHTFHFLMSQSGKAKCGWRYLRWPLTTSRGFRLLSTLLLQPPQAVLFWSTIPVSNSLDPLSKSWDTNAWWECFPGCMRRLATSG